MVTLKSSREAGTVGKQRQFERVVSADVERREQVESDQRAARLARHVSASVQSQPAVPSAAAQLDVVGRDLGADWPRAAQLGRTCGGGGVREEYASGWKTYVTSSRSFASECYRLCIHMLCFTGAVCMKHR